MRLHACIALTSLAATSGCGFYFDDNGDVDLVCGGEAPAYTENRRDPSRGVCVTYTEYTCEPGCGRCSDDPDSSGASVNNWGACESDCTGLSESTCLAATGCYAAYIEDPAADGAAEYAGCWLTSTATYASGRCVELSAYDCAERDDCSLYYVEQTQEVTFTSFNRCGPETGAVTHDPGSCTGEVNCITGEPDCPSGTTAGLRDGCWTGYCIPNTSCGPNDPGECYAFVACDANGPSCPAGTTPGIANACYTGYCIPTSDCGFQACAALTTEASCSARSDCNPVYSGMDCTCNANGCTCATTTFDHCETL
jgi:hypothetical protein